MNEQLPYEEQLNQQLADLPLPDENMAWEDMKRRLDEDDDRIIIPFWLRGCGLWSLLAVILFGLGWWWYTYDRQENKKDDIEKTTVSTNPPPVSNANPGDQRNDSISVATGGLTTQKENDLITSDKNETDNTIASNRRSKNKNRTAQTDNDLVAGIENAAIAKDKRNTQSNPNKQAASTSNQPNNKPGKKTVGKDEVDISVVAPARPGVKDNEKGKTPRDIDENKTKPDTLSKTIADVRPTDTSKPIVKDSSSKKDSAKLVNENKPKKDSSGPKSVFFSAGIAMHQLLPINGQKLTPYNAQGRKGSLADYTPSVYARINKEDKWFVQAEFRYGAPQHTRDIIYNQKITQDTFQTTRTTTSAKLKKTFYHQLPLSFNYFVAPNWSVGTGLVWNKFTSAVSEQDVIRRSLSTGQDTVLSQGVILINRDADSNFAKSYFQAIFETQYKWKRLSFGARYSFGLQPYLRFTLPGGQSQKEKNSALQLFIRYELWRPKKEKANSSQ